MLSSNKVLGGILLISGTCIGAGMLAMPIVSGPASFYYSALLLILCWGFMYLSGLLVLEVNLALEKETSYVSMARATLGETGGIITWIFFLCLLYSLLASYVSGGGDILQGLLQQTISMPLPESAGAITWVCTFGLITFMGVSQADFFNRIFMGALIAAYLLLLVISLPHVQVKLLGNGQSKYILSALPVVFTSIAFHIIIPTLRRYLNSDLVKLKRILLWGSLLPLVVYLLWELVVFGLIPKTGDMGLLAIYHSQRPASQLTASLQAILQRSLITYTSQIFIFFAIASSFIGVAYGLFDFLADGTKIPRKKLGRMVLICLTFLPPLAFALVYPDGFIFALRYAGIFVAIVHGILPVLMAWKARTSKLVGAEPVYRVPGGAPLLLLVLLFFVAIIAFDVMEDLHLLPAVTA